ncbi:MAG TPA: hypothetical protein VFK05_17530 [Polyangiaceae bacterium]|nr:hypothetical protein [Polyangiaceae bacterium]
MHPIQLEFANPGDWLTRLAEESDGYRRLVRESGGATRAAYRLARARCSATLSRSREPELSDLEAAAQLLAEKVGSHGALPIKSLLPSAKSAPPDAKSAPPGAKSAPVIKAAAPVVSSSPPAPPSPERRAVSKARARQSAPTL